MGKVIMSGIVPKLVAPTPPAPPVTDIPASDLAVGSTVKLLENGVAVEYLVVNQGIPSGSSLYDSSCNGTWLLRKDIHSNRTWDSSDNNYKNSDVRSYLNGAFLGLFDSDTQAAIQQVKIPYVNGTGTGSVASGSSGYSTKIFLLSGYEVGWTTNTVDWLPVEGAKLEYFDSGFGTASKKRIAYYNGSATGWWLRSPHTDGTYGAWYVDMNGSYDADDYDASHGVRPALILPSTALFDEETLLFKGVA